MRIEKDFKEFLELLNRKKVKYLIVGGFAFSFHGEPRYTKDIDFFVENSSENALKIVSAVNDFWERDSGLNVSDLEKKDMIIQMGYPPIRIDIITSIEAVDFAEAWEKKVIADYGSIPAFFISLDDLIRNKRACGRERDILDVKYLERMKAKKN
jgi:predicted nucleotidyltransferase